MKDEEAMDRGCDQDVRASSTRSGCLFRSVNNESEQLVLYPARTTLLMHVDVHVDAC